MNDKRCTRRGKAKWYGALSSAGLVHDGNGAEQSVPGCLFAGFTMSSGLCSFRSLVSVICSLVSVLCSLESESLSSAFRLLSSTLCALDSELHIPLPALCSLNAELRLPFPVLCSLCPGGAGWPWLWSHLAGGGFGGRLGLLPPQLLIVLLSELRSSKVRALARVLGREREDGEEGE